MLSRDQILQADDLPQETVPVPEWGGDVIVRGLTASDRDSYESTVVQVRGRSTELKRENIRALLVVRCLVDAKGERLFTDADATVLGAKSALVVDRLWDVAARLSGMREEAVGEAEADFAGAQADAGSSE